jgi:hypothetical protein
MKFIPHNYQDYVISRIVDMPIPGPGLGAFLDMGLG